MTPPTPNGFWRPSNWYLAQVAHFLTGALILQVAAAHGFNLWLTYGVFAVVTAIKEFVIDTSFFEGDTPWGSAQDWFFYQTGAATAGVALWELGWGVVFGACVVMGLFVVDVVGQHRQQPYD